MAKGLRLRRAHGLHRLERPHIRGLDLLIENLSDIGEGKDRDRRRPRDRPQSEDKGRDQRRYKRRKGPDEAEEEPHQHDQGAAFADIRRGQHRKGQGEKGTEEGAEKGHLDRVQNRPDDAL